MLETKYLLTDDQMAQFITKGYLVLRNDLPASFHERIMSKIEYVLPAEGNPGNNVLPRIPELGACFETPLVRGALTSVLGPDYIMHAHRHLHGNKPGKEQAQNWHKDGYWSSMRSHRPWWAMIFYYTQDVTEDMGPSEVMAGTQYYEKFLGEQGETVLPAGKAGTMVLIHFDLWHRAALNVSDKMRYMLKFQFVRLTAPASPSWNHTRRDLVLPADARFRHRVLWQDVWNWLKGESGGSAADSGADATDAAALARWAAELRADDAAVRAEAADELGLLGEAAADHTAQLAGLLDDASEIAALNAAYALGRMGAKGSEWLLAAMAAGTTQVATRAGYGLQGAGAVAVPGLATLLAHPDEKRRALAAFALGMIGAPSGAAVPALLAALDDASEWVRRNVIEALGLIVQPADRIVAALTGALDRSLREEGAAAAITSGDGIDYTEPQWYIVNKIGYTAALSLLRIGNNGDPNLAVGALKRALDSKDRYARAYAFEALCHYRTEEAIQAMLTFIGHSRWCADTHKASNT
ncbi:MAG: HEAT repeat domain-containing protein [Paenibacillaceae bacterium]|nr:HEAT repeat domain-containing protein [Paenibacillaceae bacterium]